MYVTDSHNLTIAVKVALNPNTTNQAWMTKIQRDFGNIMRKGENITSIFSYSHNVAKSPFNFGHQSLVEPAFSSTLTMFSKPVTFRTTFNLLYAKVFSLNRSSILSALYINAN